MMYGILFALLALCLAFFREGVWTQFTPQDVARWQDEAAEAKLDAQRYLPIQREQVGPLGTVCPKRVQHLPAPLPEGETLELVA